MLETPLILAITGFSTGFLSTWIGLLLVNIKPSLFRLAIVALFYGFGNAIVKSLPLAFEAHFLIMMALLYTMIMMGWRLSIFKTLIPTIIGILVLMMVEFLSATAVTKVLGLELTEITQGSMFLYGMLLEIILAFLLIKVVEVVNIHVFDFTENDPYQLENSSPIRYDFISMLSGCLLLLLSFQYLLNFNIIYAYRLFRVISAKNIGVITSMLMIAIFVLIIVILNQMLSMARREKEYSMQLSYLNTLDELYTAVKAEAHDRINHLQTLYGFIQLGNQKESQKYLEELMGDRIVPYHHAVQGNSGLSALFYIKSGIAASQGIQFNLKINSDMAHIAIPSYELNRIVGNLINNAFDAVNSLEKEKRWVKVEIYEQERNYVVAVTNHGDIDRHMAQKMFERGYTTKEGDHGGLGLHIIKLLAEKHGGGITFHNESGMVKFTVVLPKSKGSEASALAGSKYSLVAGAKFPARN